MRRSPTLSRKCRFSDRRRSMARVSQPRGLGSHTHPGYLARRERADGANDVSPRAVDSDHGRHRLVRAGLRPICPREPRPGATGRVLATNSSSTSSGTTSVTTPASDGSSATSATRTASSVLWTEWIAVVHAAALKQVDTAEYNPFECIRTNVLGVRERDQRVHRCRRRTGGRSVHGQGILAGQPLRGIEARARTSSSSPGTTTPVTGAHDSASSATET